MGKKLQEWFSEAVFPAEGQNLASDGVVRVRKGEARSLKSGGAWIYDNEVEAVFRERQQNEPAGQDMQPQKTLDGEIVSVLDFDGYFLGYGFYNAASRIRVRMLTRYQKDPVTIRLFREKVQKAWDLRKAVVETDSCRLIFGEADFLPGLTVDKFGSVLVVESLCLGMDRWKLLVLKLLIETLMKDGIEITGIYERSDARARELEGMPRIKGFIGPEFPVRVPIVENGVHYLVDVQDGQKTGFFLDQKRTRSLIGDLVRRLSRGGDVKVLDCFTHTGSFGLNAAMAGASSVLSVDASETAIQAAREHVRLNQCEEIISCLTADIFELLPALEKQGEKYDLVILDPPAFAKSRQAAKNAVKGYREINLRGMRLLRDGGFLATCSCSRFMEEELFRKTISEAARGARVRLRQLSFSTQAPDHPILWGDADSYYLKFFLFQVI